MGIDGLILLDNNGRPIIQSGFRAASAAYPLLHIDAVNNALSKASRLGDVDPVIYVSAYSIEDSPSTFIDILHEYFGSLSSVTIKENFDVVYQLLEETLDAGGHPLTTSPNALRANINTTINSGAHLGSAGGPFSSPIPWRKAGLRYAHNEIYFDMVEELKAVVNRNGVPLSSSVFGKIETNARLSGTPDCLLSFTNPKVLADCAFHPCVRLSRWSRDKTFSFVPPDGKFILAEYKYSPNAPPVSTIAAPPAAMYNVPIPFVLKTNFDLQDYNGAVFRCHINVSSQCRPLENVVIELHLGDGASGIKCIAARGTGGLGHGGVGSMDMGMGGNTGASWAFDSRRKVLKWEISNVPPSSSWNIRGSFSTPTIAPRPSHALQVRFEIQSYTFSSLKVEQLKITGETYKLYKGVRGRALGNVEWRW
ncbi:clathrin adaptor mu subunit [Gymnopilus junonius]|uniref:Clathrin adaptor mu subunit n=1 Tax=Gymnopilus junonius TaxID=109634 RepID=A0A9P5P3F5_GYMJU|nr:clathrin adaptor mu subunit [Gymnopilus junonius]